MDDPHGAEHWDARYASSERVWSGAPNHRLVAESGALPPGRALEVGCGEGADALWLAGRGWSVTAVDVSAVALERAAARAAERGEEIAERISWQRADARTWSPPAGAYDLVTAHFLHPPPAERPGVVRRLAAAVAPGGLLLYVGHDPADPHFARHRHRDLLVAAGEVAALLDGDAWDVEVAGSLARPGTDPEGRAATLHDAVVRARRR